MLPRKDACMRRGDADVRERRMLHRNTVWLYVQQAINYLLPFLVIPYLARVLAADGYALYAYVLSLMGFVQIFIEFGYNLSAVKSVAFAQSDRELSLINGSVLQARLGLSILVAFGVSLIASFVPILQQNFWYVALAYASSCVKSLVPNYLFQGKGDLRPLAIRCLLSRGIFFAAILMVVHKPEDLLLVPLCDLISNIVALIWSCAAARRMFGCGIVFVGAKKVLDDAVRSASYFATSASATFLNVFVTLMFGVLVHDSVLMGCWSLSIAVIAGIQALYAPLVTALYPHMVRNGDFSLLKKVFVGAFPVVVIATIAFAFASGAIIELLGGQEYRSGAYIASLLSPVLLFSFYNAVTSWPLLGASGHEKSLFLTTLGSALATVLMTVAAIACGLTEAWMLCGIRVASEISLALFRGIACALILSRKGGFNRRS